MFGLFLAMGFSYGKYFKEAWKDLYDISIKKIVDLKGFVAEDVKLASDSSILSTRHRYRKELAHNLQKHGVEITDIMLAELDVWEQPVEGFIQGHKEMKVSRANTMIAERMLGYDKI